jgi:hypothetical protein
VTGRNFGARYNKRKLTVAGDALTATEGSASRDILAHAIESARSRLRETIANLSARPPVLEGPPWRRGFFPGTLWILQSTHDAQATWWREQAIRYSKLLIGMTGEGLGCALLPSVCRWADATHDSVAGNAIIEAAQSLLPRLEQQEPTVLSLMDAVLLFRAGMNDAATAHVLAARRWLVRGDGSLAVQSESPHDLALVIYAFGAAYQFTRDPRFLAVAENCAFYFLETQPADAAAASALMQLSSIAADSAKARFYSMAARQYITAIGDRELDDEAQYFLLDAASRCAGATLVPLNGVVHVPEAPPVPEPEPEPVKEPEPPRRKLVGPWTFLLAPFIFFLLIEVVIFRSNFYTRFMEPESSAGTFEGTFQHEDARARGPRQILILGSSRIAEGFSAKRVNQLEPKGGYYFINGAVSGAGPRCMYYLLRDLDPRRDRYKAIVLTIDDYTDPDDYEDLADREEDVNTVIARLRLTDVYSFTQSFTKRKTKWAVLASSLIKSISYQRDLQEFLDHPQHRIEKATLYRGHFFDWAYDYGGSEHSLAGTTIDWNTKPPTITFPPNIPQPEQDYLRPRLVITAPQKDAHVRAYQTRWLGAIADLYRNSKTRIIFVQAPRTPLPRPVSLANWPWTTADKMRERPWVTVVDPRTFENLERPELFSDYAHLNSEGQKAFSPALAATVKSLLETQPQAHN